MVSVCYILDGISSPRRHPVFPCPGEWVLFVRCRQRSTGPRHGAVRSTLPNRLELLAKSEFTHPSVWHTSTHAPTQAHILTNTRTHTPVHTRIHTRTQRHIDHLECVSVQEPSGDEIAPPRRLSGVTLGPAHATPTVLKPRPRCFDHTLPSHSLPEFHKDAFTMRGNPVVVQMAFRFCYVWIKAKSVSAEEIIIFWKFRVVWLFKSAATKPQRVAYTLKVVSLIKKYASLGSWKWKVILRD